MYKKYRAYANKPSGQERCSSFNALRDARAWLYINGGGKITVRIGKCQYGMGLALGWSDWVFKEEVKA